MQIPVHHLLPSNLFSSRTPYHVHTILGSCISVCLWDPQAKLGGINHFMLPFWSGEAGSATPRYGNIAIERLIETLEQNGCHHPRMQAKIFGGATVLDNASNSDIMKVGQRNIEIADSVLNDYCIPILARCVGGNSGYKLIYKTYSGEALIKRITK